MKTSGTFVLARPRPLEKVQAAGGSTGALVGAATLSLRGEDGGGAPWLILLPHAGGGGANEIIGDIWDFETTLHFKFIQTWTYPYSYLRVTLKEEGKKSGNRWGGRTPEAV